MNRKTRLVEAVGRGGWSAKAPDTYFLRDASPPAIADAMMAWWERLLEHAESVTDADTLVADAWVETGRVIGHVQRRSEAVGMDRGARVCLTVLPISAALAESGFDDETLREWVNVLFAAFETTRRTDDVQARLRALFGGAALLWWCEGGRLMAEVTP